MWAALFFGLLLVFVLVESLRTVFTRLDKRERKEDMQVLVAENADLRNRNEDLTKAVRQLRRRVQELEADDPGPTLN